MFSDRFTYARSDMDTVVPHGASIVVFNAQSVEQIAPIMGLNPVAIQGFAPFVSELTRSGIKVAQNASDPVDVAIVLIPKSKEEARDLIYRANAIARLVIVDGQKTDGIDSVLKELKSRVNLSAPLSKAHGKIAWFSAGADLSDYQSHPKTLASGFVTTPGVFSADGIDPASEMLARALPNDLRGVVADFGAGWGFLTKSLLSHEKITKIFAVEADFNALENAKQNVADDRVQFVWDDVTQWRAPRGLDAVVMNPPFHTAGRADPALGQAFIRGAAANLGPSGQLFMVANRHLPYEATLEQCFQVVSELDGSSKFKVYHAARPRRTKR